MQIGNCGVVGEVECSMENVISSVAKSAILQTFLITALVESTEAVVALTGWRL